MKLVTAIRTHLVLVGLFVLFAVGYIWLNLIKPADRPVLEAAKLTTVQSAILILAVIVPYIGIWITGLIGYIRLHNYVSLIKPSGDSKSLGLVATGILGVLISLPITSILSSISQVMESAHSHEALLIRRAGIYVGIVLLLWAFYQLMRGTRLMVDDAVRPYRRIPQLAVFIFMLLGGVYIYFVLTNPLFETVQVRGHLPGWLVIDTIVLPRMLAWYWGLHSAWNLYQYARVVGGRIYRLAFCYLAIGIGVVTLSIILLQYVQAMSVVASLPIGIILLVVYVILVVISAGFMLLARGGKELARIEEV